MRIPAVATAAISAAPSRRASSTMSTTASAVRSDRLRLERAVSSSPSPSRVTSARSTTVLPAAAGRRSPTWSLTEFVPTSITAKRTGSRPSIVLSPRARQTFGRSASCSSRTAAIDERGILRLDGDRARRPAPGRDLRQLRHAAAEPVVGAPLVHGDRGERRVRTARPRRAAARACTPRARAPGRRRRARPARSRRRRRRAGTTPLSTGRHCSSPSPSTASSCFTSIRPSRTFTEASLSCERR